jgi:hypothetical protein
MNKASLFLALFFLLGVSEVLGGSPLLVPPRTTTVVPPRAIGPPNITIETPTETLIFKAASSYNAAWAPLDPSIALNIMNAHNQVRATIGVAMLTWSYQLEQSSWFWNRNCIPAHDPNLPLTVGENIISLTSDGVSDASLAVGGAEQWMSEIAAYTCESDTCKTGITGPYVCGNFVQAIWNTTTHIGCSIVNCNQNSPFTHIAGGGGDAWKQMNCRYYPPAYAGDRPLPAAYCPRINSLKRAGAIRGLPLISTGKGPLGSNVYFPTNPGKASLSTGAVAEFPK